MTRVYVMVAGGIIVLSVAYVGPVLAGQMANRQIRQQKRIHQGVVSGELTAGEAADLEREQCRIQHRKRNAWSDGELSPGERAHLHYEQDRASADIYRKKHNDATKP